ncbi:MAG: diphosphate--fructose-6-phosphate 1-phosphotransferase [Thermodesulfovibrionales bacterium]|nr:diphosphate--fructose-6-phosphate 1-phosphotransferase [Thermodesulfovibrionales bacterium]
MAKGKKETVGIIVGGGPAPGINGVISSATIEAINEGKQVVGIMDGFKRLCEGDKNCAIPFNIDDVSRIHTQGGSILRTSREKPERIRERFKIIMSTLKAMGIKYLITIGGEGTLFVANKIEKESRGSLNVVHVPKTIDNDIPLPGGAPTFGYETARHWGVEIVKNVMEDAKTTGRWYFITTMGRLSGYLALGIGKAAGATVTLISEEFKESKISLKKLSDILTGSIIKRLSMNRDHGVAILAEGIADRLDLDELSQHESYVKDETGSRIRLSEIQLGRILKNLVKNTLETMNLNVTIVDKNIGYELRAADPIPFDVEYTRNLGYGAIRYLLKGGTGAMIVYDEGYLKPIPFVEMIDYETGLMKVRKVNTESEIYEVGRKYMIRLEKEDFNGNNLKLIAKTANMDPISFKQRFAYIVGLQ